MELPNLSPASYTVAVADSESLTIRDSSPLNTQEGGDHYKGMEIQPVVFIEANQIPFLEACIIKRACRHQDKNGVEDLKKIIHEAKLIAKMRYNVTI